VTTATAERAALGTMTAGAVVAVTGSLLPWVRTGEARRNSYDVFALADRLGFATDGAVAQALRWWPLVPLIATIAVVAAWWGRPRTGGAVGLVAGAYAAGVGFAVGTADAAGVLDIEPGAGVTAAGGLVLALASAAAVLVSWRRPTGRAR